MSQPQLTLIQGANAHTQVRAEKTAGSLQWQAPGLQAQSADPVRRLFDHWVVMNKRMARRCKLGPDRRRAISSALAMGYDEDDLMLAIEGHAVDPFEWAKTKEARIAYSDLDWLLEREKRIEAAIERGEALREQFKEYENRAMAEAAKPAEPETPSKTPEQVAEERRKLSDFAARLAGRTA